MLGRKRKAMGTTYILCWNVLEIHWHFNINNSTTVILRYTSVQAIYTWLVTACSRSSFPSFQRLLAQYIASNSAHPVTRMNRYNPCYNFASKVLKVRHFNLMFHFTRSQFYSTLGSVSRQKKLFMKHHFRHMLTRNFSTYTSTSLQPCTQWFCKKLHAISHFTAKLTRVGFSAV